MLYATSANEHETRAENGMPFSPTSANECELRDVNEVHNDLGMNINEWARLVF